MTISDADKILNFYDQHLTEFYGRTFADNMRSNKQIGLQNHSIYSFIKEIITKDIQDINKNWIPTDWISLIEYVKGDYFNEHTDAYGNKANNNPNLLYSAGYLLNNKFDGGSFILNGKRQVHKIGELFYFKRDELHEVEPIKLGKRYSLHFGIQKKTGNKLLI